ncbi:MAG: glucose-6-phosphate dehydrogenase [Thermoguttaceae bacterium]|nr:glucose-6-phosphate dehydrogenase [Thermoguttaceae bacterium]
MFYELVLFGASGDLTSRKLIPALFRLYCRGRLPRDIVIVGVARTEMSSQQWRAKLAETTTEFVSSEADREHWERFAQLIFYLPGDAGSDAFYPKLKSFLADQEAAFSDSGSASGPQRAPSDALLHTLRVNRVYYLAVSPGLYPNIISRLGQFGMAQDEGIHRRVVIVEKPFGRDLATARELNHMTHAVFEERQIFRIDHYLGKETVNNIFALRFANTIFEPLWNRNYIDHVQITAGESQTVGRRGAFYETTGVLRDMFQNHLLQLLAITAMEPPVKFDAQAVRDEKVKVLRAVRRVNAEEAKSQCVFGQYVGYRTEPGVAPDSQTPTFAAVKLFIDNWRWKDVPFYLRSGKAMSCQTTQIVIMYREPPHSIFGKDFPTAPGSVNRLLIQIQPSEGIHLSFLSKVPDSDMDLRSSSLSFSFKEHFPERLPESYERLLLDALNGDSSFFLRNDEVETAWEVVDPFQQAQAKLATGGTAVATYDPGDWGPDASNQWMSTQGRNWFDLCPVLH